MVGRMMKMFLLPSTLICVCKSLVWEMQKMVASLQIIFSMIGKMVPMFRIIFSFDKNMVA
jgi:hypothetical protein